MASKRIVVPLGLDQSRERRRMRKNESRTLHDCHGILSLVGGFANEPSVQVSNETAGFIAQDQYSLLHGECQTVLIMPVGNIYTFKTGPGSARTRPSRCSRSLS